MRGLGSSKANARAQSLLGGFAAKTELPRRCQEKAVRSKEGEAGRPSATLGLGLLTKQDSKLQQRSNMN